MGSGVGRVKAEDKGWLGGGSVGSNGVRRGKRVRDEELGRLEGSILMERERESNGVGSVMGWFGIVYDGGNGEGNGGGGGDGVGRLMECGGVMGSGVKVGEAGRE